MLRWMVKTNNMKAKNKRRRLEGRIKDWDSIKGDKVTEKLKMVNKSGFTRPGSFKK